MSQKSISFVNREDCLEAFDRKLESISSSKPSVLAYHGMGGIGKTELKEELRRHLRKQHPDTVHAEVDFVDSGVHTLQKALIRLRRELHEDQKRHKVSFPSFELAFTAYSKLADPEVALNEFRLPWIDEAGIAGDIIGIASETPGISLVSKIYKAVDKIGGAASKWLTRRGRDELRRIENLKQPVEIQKRLHSFWTADIKAWLKNNPSCSAVIFLDTFEALQMRKTGRTPHGPRPDDWVRKWTSGLDGLLVVVTGRRKLNWHKDRHVKNYSVGDLELKYRLELLEGQGMAEEETREVVAERSKGVPQYLDLALDTYHQISEGGQVPQPTDFGSELEDLLRELLPHLATAKRDAIDKLSIPESFDLELFKGIVEDCGTGYTSSARGLQDLLRYSFVMEVSDGRYALHEIVRDALKAQMHPDDEERVRNYLFRHFKEVLEGGIEIASISDDKYRALREGFHHGKEVEEAALFLEWYWEEQEPFFEAAEYGFLSEMHEEAVEYAEKTIKEENRELYLDSVENLVGLYAESGTLDEAEKLMVEVLRGRKQMEKRDWKVFASMDNRAYFYRRNGEVEEAIPLLKEALAGLRGLTEETYNALLESQQNAREEVVDDMSEKVREGIKSRFTTTDNLAQALQERAQEHDFEDAETLYLDAFRGRKMIHGEKHKHTLTSIGNLASLLQARGQKGDRYEARKLYRVVIDTFTETHGREHPATLTYRDSYASLLPDERVTEVVEIRSEIRNSFELVLGLDHRDTLIATINLASSLLQRGEETDNERALALLRSGEKICKQKFGEEHQLSKKFASLSKKATR